MTSDIVRARFIEATDTERRMPRGGVAGKSGYWPGYVHSFEDMNGWGTKRLAEEREMRMRRIPPSAAAISRYIEVLTWTAAIIQDEDCRRLVWVWARCQTSNLSFAKWCRDVGLVKMTAYRRLGAVFQAISTNLSNNKVLLRNPDEIWMLPKHPVLGNSTNTLAIDDDSPPPPNKTFAIFDGDRPVDTLNSPQAIALFAKFLAKTNRRRRRERERRRKLGLEESAA
ncbi:DUF6362 family protein [Bradyrhizobium sp. Arg237L]|uniref:DUF6362 family protein n=1 Tax=Bradyrhizobium sp. Arg237L TaxID=3003352 RepID=UPI00249E07A7|nr:DUF6362 family protein [Bradyrhizobium sp. Arg237L]MDI4231434.1 DUF6362 family protein [Bradyrhizobium sp. Arg237L]